MKYKVTAETPHITHEWHEVEIEANSPAEAIEKAKLTDPFDWPEGDKGSVEYDWDNFTYEVEATAQETT
jgi:hypothetical protein